jgi:hypothetical protein
VAEKQGEAVDRHNISPAARRGASPRFPPPWRQGGERGEGEQERTYTLKLCDNEIDNGSSHKKENCSGG